MHSKGESPVYPSPLQTYRRYTETCDNLNIAFDRTNIFKRMVAKLCGGQLDTRWPDIMVSLSEGLA